MNGEPADNATDHGPTTLPPSDSDDEIFYDAAEDVDDKDRLVHSAASRVRQLEVQLSNKANQLEASRNEIVRLQAELLEAQKANADGTFASSAGGGVTGKILAREYEQYVTDDLSSPSIYGFVHFSAEISFRGTVGAVVSPPWADLPYGYLTLPYSTCHITHALFSAGAEEGIREDGEEDRSTSCNGCSNDRRSD